MSNEEFLLLPTNILIEIISNEELDVKTEESVFKAVMNWVRHDLEPRQQEMAKVYSPKKVPIPFQVLEHVRLPLCTSKFLVNSVSQDPLIRADIKCRDLVDEAKDYQLLPAERVDHQSARTKPRRPVRVGELLYAGGEYIQ